ncbi:hypothetical protein, partial [Candidatus Methanoperedens nitratireducens]|uniref:hypothetical protein n=1 Tax=Candidatus Methanoperedens nitratireducens TaxID=1392998 RepID=UPI001C545493
MFELISVFSLVESNPCALTLKFLLPSPLSPALYVHLIYVASPESSLLFSTTGPDNKLIAPEPELSGVNGFEIKFVTTFPLSLLTFILSSNVSPAATTLVVTKLSCIYTLKLSAIAINEA